MDDCTWPPGRRGVTKSDLVAAEDLARRHAEALRLQLAFHRLQELAPLAPRALTLMERRFVDELDPEVRAELVVEGAELADDDPDHAAEAQDTLLELRRELNHIWWFSISRHVVVSG